MEGVAAQGCIISLVVPRLACRRAGRGRGLPIHPARALPRRPRPAALARPADLHAAG